MAVEPEVIDGQTSEIMLRPTLAPAPVTLFGTDDPLEFVGKVTRIADALADIITKRNLFSNIQGRKFVTVEGWTTVGSMVGVFPVLRWTRQIEVDGKSGWEARVEAVTRSGDIVGAAEAMCLKGESGTWTKTSIDNAVRSMAQTRATSKALRQPLDFLVKMAGYVATPAEEMDDQTSAPAVGGQRATRATAAQPKEAATSAPSAAALEPSVEQQEVDRKTSAKTNAKHSQGKGAIPASIEALSEVTSELYEEAIALGEVYALKLDPKCADPRAESLKRLDEQCLAVYKFPLDQLNATTLQKVVNAYRLKVEAGV